MKQKKRTIILFLFVVMLLISLLIKLRHVPGGMILSGLVLGIMVIIALSTICFLLAAITKWLFKKTSLLNTYLILSIIGFLSFHYKLYSPTLTIIVPNGHVGKVHLVRSNVTDNILSVDSHGIAYVNEWTFNHTYSEPIVLDANGNKLNHKCKWFNHSTFWSKTKSVLATATWQEKSTDIPIESLSFYISPDSNIDAKRYNHQVTDIHLYIDRSKLRQ